MEALRDPWDPKDKEKLKNKFNNKEEDIPCNIWATIKEILERLSLFDDVFLDIEKRLKALEEVK